MDLVEYKTISTSAVGAPCKYVLSMMDHLTRYTILTPIPNKSADTVAKVIIDRIISTFGPPEMLHSGQGTEFENNVIHQLQTILGYKKTCTSHTVRKGTLCPNEYTRRCMQCSRCTAQWVVTSGRSSCQWCN